MGIPFFKADCPRCGTKKITFDVIGRALVGHYFLTWERAFEVPSTCRECRRVTVWSMHLANGQYELAVQRSEYWNEERNLSDQFTFDGYISQKDIAAIPPPDLVPDQIAAIFKEAAMAKAVNCPNASAAMSRLCLDLVTKELLPGSDEDVEQPSRDQRKRLFDRLDWLFDHGRLPKDLSSLAHVIRESGNDGVHDGTLTDIDAADLLDFTIAVLERVYTVPGRVTAARERYNQRRST